jgi:hypothetical protein
MELMIMTKKLGFEVAKSSSPAPALQRTLPIEQALGTLLRVPDPGATKCRVEPVIRPTKNSVA